MKASEIRSVQKVTWWWLVIQVYRKVQLFKITYSYVYLTEYVLFFNKCPIEEEQSNAVWREEVLTV